MNPFGDMLSTKWKGAHVALALLVLASTVRAGDGGQLSPDQLPPAVTASIKDNFDAEPLFGRQEVEGEKTCYIVTARHKGNVIEIYSSPDGRVLIRKPEAFSLTGWMADLASGSLFLLLPGLVVGAIVRGMVRMARGQALSVPAGWLAAWVGAGVGAALVVFNLATAPREKDVPVLGAYCVVWAAIAASVIEVATLAVDSSQSNGSRHKWVIKCSVIAAACLGLSIPLDVLRIHRENSLFKQLVLRPATGDQAR